MIHNHAMFAYIELAANLYASVSISSAGESLLQKSHYYYDTFRKTDLEHGKGKQKTFLMLCEYIVLLHKISSIEKVPKSLMLYHAIPFLYFLTLIKIDKWKRGLI